MSAISDAFHSFLDTIKTDMSSAWTTITTSFSGTVSTFLAGLGSDIESEGPVVLQIVTQAVLAVATGGTSAFEPAFQAALTALATAGISAAEHVVSGLVSATIANLPTPTVMTPTVATTPTPLPATPPAS